jgi:hypothetical protein
VLIGSIFALLLLGGLFRLKKTVRNHLFPDLGTEKRGQAMAELMVLQARLQEEASRRSTPEDEE